MFSAQQLENFSKKKRVSQQTFDEAVKENIEEFDLEPDEAVASAVAEFESQGVDLSNIIATATGGDLTGHPAAQAAKEIEAGINETNLQKVERALGDLRDAIESEERGKAGPFALSVSAVPLAVTALQSATDFDDETTQLAALRTLNVVLPLSSDLRSAFREACGPNTLMGALFSASGGGTCLARGSGRRRGAHHVAVWTAALSSAAASAQNDENGKVALMDANISLNILKALQECADRVDGTGDLVMAACAALTALTTADDQTQPSSSAFLNARKLAKGGAVASLLRVMMIHDKYTRDETASLCSALRLVAANDEICQEAADAGAVPVAHAILDRAIAGETLNAQLARSVLSLLRQLASSDAVKASIVSCGGLSALRDALRYSQEEGIMPWGSVAEPALGLLANLALRSPDISKSATENGCATGAVELMKEMLKLRRAEMESAGNNGKSKSRVIAALRQGCMAMRNMSARCVEAREGILAAGGEAMVREAQRMAPAACQDVASAALRDFGLTNYT